jgi:hypothetical protein
VLVGCFLQQCCTCCCCGAKSDTKKEKADQEEEEAEAKRLRLLKSVRNLQHVLQEDEAALEAHSGRNGIAGKSMRILSSVAHAGSTQDAQSQERNRQVLSTALVSANSRDLRTGAASGLSMRHLGPVLSLEMKASSDAGGNVIRSPSGHFLPATQNPLVQRALAQAAHAVALANARSSGNSGSLPTAELDPMPPQSPRQQQQQGNYVAAPQPTSPAASAMGALPLSPHPAVSMPQFAVPVPAASPHMYHGPRVLYGHPGHQRNSSAPPQMAYPGMIPYGAPYRQSPHAGMHSQHMSTGFYPPVPQYVVMDASRIPVAPPRGYPVHGSPSASYQAPPQAGRAVDM